MKVISQEQLMETVPSIFTRTAHERVSERYSLISTWDCVQGLAQAGFYPVKAVETRKRDNKQFARHMLRFRRQDSQMENGNFAEVVLINSHDGLSSYQMKAGIYRQICSNGLVVGNDYLNHKIKHAGNVIEKVVGAANDIIEVIPEVIDRANQWQSIQLTNKQKEIFAESAMLLKWDKETIQDSSLTPDKLLAPKRFQDRDNNLWTTFNVIQENMIKGGLIYYNSKENTRSTTRAVNSITESTKLNEALWNLTEKMAELV